MATTILTNASDTYTAIATDSVIYGLDGNDIIYVNSTDTQGSVDVYGGEGGGYIGGSDNSYTSNLFLYGGYAFTALTEAGSTSSDSFYGADGVAVLMTGSAFNWATLLSSGSVVVYGAAASGNDTMYGGSAPVAEYGFDGNDTLYAGSGYSSGTYTGFFAGSTVTTHAVNLGLYGGDGTDTLFGGTGTDWLYGGNGDDTIYSGTGNASLLSGDAGNDLLWVQGGNANAFGGDGNDLVYSIGSSSTMYGGNGDDQMAASNSGSVMSGDAGNDILFGGTGADTLYGGTGNDAIAGYFGNDVLYGGTGTDYFNLTFDVKGGQYDNIGDWNVGGIQDYLYLNAGLQSVTTFIQQSGYVDVHVALGTAAYDVFVFGGTVANVQADTFFV